jgi:hypothetical protein
MLSFLIVQQVVGIVTTMHSTAKWLVQPWTGDNFLDCIILLQYIYQDSTHILPHFTVWYVGVIKYFENFMKTLK